MVGLVAITPSAGYVSVGQSIFISLCITIICNIAVHWREHTSVDDALDVFPTHRLGGIVGTVFAGFFVGVLVDGGDGLTMLMYCLCIILVFAYSFVMSMALYWLTNKMIPMRVSKQSERMGLDMSQHDEVYDFAGHEDEIKK